MRETLALLALLLTTVLATACSRVDADPVHAELPAAAGARPTAARPATSGPPAGCVEDGGFDDVLDRWSCCSGVVVVGTVVCVRPEDRGGTWDSCIQICGTRLVGGCVPAGGFDDILESTKCCNGSSVPGSGRCLDPADYGTSWRSCVHKCA